MTSILSFIAVAWREHGDQFMWAGGIIAMVGVLWKWPLKPMVGRFQRILAFLERLEVVMGAVEETLLKNNGGSTILDKTDATHRLAQETAARLCDLITKMEGTK
jgi:hypothetical protein